ncbi:MAG: PQQ-dependent sugar dehydrogenase [Nakamurella sp.]
MAKRLLAPIVMACCCALTACSTSAAPAPGTTSFVQGPSSSTTPSTPASLPLPSPVSTTPPLTSSTESTGPVGPVTATDLVTGLNTPWGIGFLPDGTALVTGRDAGTVQAVTVDGKITDAGRVPGVTAGGERGLLGLAVSPQYATDHAVFVYYSTGADNRVARLQVAAGGRLGPPKPILTGLPVGPNHNGGRMAFGPDGLLYIGVGDAGNRDGAQDLGYLGGKILRINPDGSGAKGNPFPPAPLVYSYGHRNVQGLAFDQQGRLWSAEFGQDTWDELNLIKAGGNYGWPIVEGPSKDPEYVAPQRVWATSEASPSGIAIWHGSVWMAALHGETLWQIPITGTGTGGQQTGEPVAHFRGKYGRLRTAIAAPDGSLWVTTSNTDGRGEPKTGDDRILRVDTG